MSIYLFIFNTKKWNAIIYIEKLFPSAKIRVLALGNNFSMYIVVFHFSMLKAFYPM
jgi:hypothetical protein